MTPDYPDAVASALDNSPDAGPSIDVPGIVREAVEQSPCGHKEAAYAVGYQPDYWCRVLAGERGITLERLGLLPRGVQCGLVARWAAALGLVVTRPESQRRGDLDLARLLESGRVRIIIESLDRAA